MFRNRIRDLPEPRPVIAPLLSRRLVAALAVAGVLCIAVSPAEAQQRRRGSRVDPGLLKNAPSLLKAVADVASNAARSTVRLMVEDRPVAMGTIIRDDGVVLTKASELSDGFVVELPDGRRVPGTILGVMKEHDLAAVKVDAAGLFVAKFDLSAVNQGHPGAWVFTPGVGQEGVVSAGNLSVGGLRKIPSSGTLLGVLLGEPRSGIPVVDVVPGGAADRAGLRAGDLIVEVNGAPVGRMRDFTRALRNSPPDVTLVLGLSREGQGLITEVMLIRGQLGVTLSTEAVGVSVEQVTPNTAASEAGLKQGDIILALDDRVVRDRQTLTRYLSTQYRPGEDVEITVLRKGEEQVLSATLGYRTGRSQRGDFQNGMGTRLSGRAVDFPAVLQHDSVLNAEQMGGPLVDLQGRILGMNIARAGRVETYALPAQVIQAAIPELLSGKLPTATAPANADGGEPMPQQDLEE